MGSGISGTSANGLSAYGADAQYAPAAGGADSAASTALLDATTANDALTDEVMQQTENMNTAFTIRSSIASALHAMSNQAQSFAQQFIGDEIAQEKKSNENAGKAV